jgi:hypothetical protein
MQFYELTLVDGSIMHMQIIAETTIEAEIAKWDDGDNDVVSWRQIDEMPEFTASLAIPMPIGPDGILATITAMANILTKMQAERDQDKAEISALHARIQQLEAVNQHVASTLKL